MKNEGCIAQSVEQSAFNQLVVGSSPTIPINTLKSASRLVVSGANQKNHRRFFCRTLLG